MKHKILRKNVKEIRDGVPHKIILLGDIAINPGILSNTEPICPTKRDVVGIAVPSLSSYFGLETYCEEFWMRNNGCNIFIFEIRKIFDMFCKQDIRVAPLLWLNKRDYIYSSKLGRLICQNKHIFSSKMVYKSFINAAKTLMENAHSKRSGVCPGRAKMFDTLGYDTKCVHDAIYWASVCKDFLSYDSHIFNFTLRETSEIVFFDRILKGKISFELLHNVFLETLEHCDKLYVNTSLLDYPDTKVVNNLLIKVLESNFSYRRCYND